MFGTIDQGTETSIATTDGIDIITIGERTDHMTPSIHRGRETPVIESPINEKHQCWELIRYIYRYRIH